MPDILTTIRSMADNPNISLDEIDAFVSECIDFLQRSQEDRELDNEIFDLELTRQETISKKMKNIFI